MLDSEDPATTTIVVGVDGSPRSEDAVSFAGRLAGASAARIVLVNAYPHAPLDRAYGAPAIPEVLRSNAEAMLGRTRSTLPADAAVTTQAVADPTPARALNEVAHAEGAALIVLGSSHVGRLGRVTPGSTAERLMHGAPCAVVVVPSGAREDAAAPIGPIGVAFDDSPESHVALDAAVAAARALHAPLHVIGVCDVDSYCAPALQYGPGYYVNADTVREDAATQLASGVATIPDDVGVQQILLFGSPAHELIQASSGLGMLFVGSRGYGPLRAVLLGGVGGALVRDAACPVVVTPRGAAVDTHATTAAAAAAR